MHIPKWLIASAGILFVVLVAALAFFLGRETSHPPTGSIAVSAAPRDLPSVPDASPAPEGPPPRKRGPLLFRGRPAPGRLCVTHRRRQSPLQLRTQAAARRRRRSQSPPARRQRVTLHPLQARLHQVRRPPLTRPNGALMRARECRITSGR